MSERTEDEERLVVWLYYLKVAIQRVARAETPELKKIWQDNGYRDVVEVLEEIKTSLQAERQAKYPFPCSDCHGAKMYTTEWSSAADRDPVLQALLVGEPSEGVATIRCVKCNCPSMTLGVFNALGLHRHFKAPLEAQNHNNPVIVFNDSTCARYEVRDYQWDGEKWVIHVGPEAPT